MTLHRGILEIDANIPGHGQTTGEFHIVGNVEISEQVAMDYEVEGAGQRTNAILGGYADPNSQTTRRRGFWIDLGAGSHIFEINFVGWEGAVDGNGDPVQWGNTGSTQQTTAADATGADPLTQMQVMLNYLRHGTTDSVSPARWRVGEYSPSGLFEDHLDVAVNGPQNVHAYDQPNEFNGRMTVVEVEDLESVQDAKEELDF